MTGSRSGLTRMLKPISLVAVIVLLTAACTTESSAPQSRRSPNGQGSGARAVSGDDEVEVSNEVRSFARTYCETLTPCCPGDRAPDAPDTFLSLCEAALGRELAKGFPAAAGKACLDAVRTAKANRDLCSLPNLYASHCQPVFEQDKPALVMASPGAACGGTVESSGLAIDLTGNKGGPYCDGNTTFCERSSRTCRPVLATGATCTSSTDCGAASRCTSTGSKRSCQPLSRMGGACKDNFDCLGLASCTAGTCGRADEAVGGVAGEFTGGVCYTRLL